MGFGNGQLYTVSCIIILIPYVVKSVGESSKADADGSEPPAEQVCPVDQAVSDGDDDQRETCMNILGVRDYCDDGDGNGDDDQGKLV